MVTVLERERLPDTRRGYNRKVKVGVFKFYITVNFYDDGRVGEVFVQPSAKEGTVISGFCDALTTTISIALQYGVPWSALSEKYKGHRFEPNDRKYPSIVHAIAQSVDELIEERAKHEKAGKTVLPAAEAAASDPVADSEQASCVCPVYPPGTGLASSVDDQHGAMHPRKRP